MNITQTHISALYVALFGRASEGSGNKYWQDTAKTNNLSVSNVANLMLAGDASKDFFIGSIDSNANFISHIYKTTLNKSADAEGKAYWTQLLDSGASRDVIVSELIKAALNPVYSKSEDKDTKAAFNTLLNKIIVSNVVSDSVENIPGGDIKSALKVFEEINNAITDLTTSEDIRKLIESKRDILNIDTSKLIASLQANSRIKIVSEITGRSEDEISKELAPQPTPDPNPQPDPKPEPQPQPNPKPAPDPKPQPQPKPEPQPEPQPNSGAEGSLKQMVDGFGSTNVIGYSAKIEEGGKKYFVSILAADNNGVNLSADQKINLSAKDGVVKTADGKILKANVFVVKNFPQSDSLEVDKSTAILGAFTKDGHKFSAKDQESGVPYSHSFQPKSGVKFNDEGFFENSLGLVEGTTDGVSAEKSGLGAGGMVYKLVKGNQTTYYVTNKEAVPESGYHTGTVVIEGAKPGDKIKFADKDGSLEKAENESSLKPNVKQFIKDGDDTIVYVNGNRAGFSNGDDLKIVFKGVNIDPEAKDGAFNLTQNVLSEGIARVSDADGFVKLFNDAPAVKIDGVTSIYKKDGKFYQDAQASKPLDVSALNVKAVKFDSGNVYTFKAAKKSQNKDAIKAYNEQNLTEKSKEGDTLKTADALYVFHNSGNIKSIISDDFTFENGSFFIGKLSLEQAKNINKEAFLSGKIGRGVFPNDYSTIETQGVKFNLKANGEVRSFTANFEKAKEILAGGLKDKILDGAVTLAKDSMLTNAELKTLAENRTKFADGAVHSAKLSVAELTSLETDIAKKIANSAVRLTDTNPLSKEQLVSLVAFSDKLSKDAVTKAQKLSVDDFYEIFGKNLLASGKLSSDKIADGILEIADKAQNLQEAINGRLYYFTDKLKSLKVTDGKMLKITASNFKKITGDKFDADDNIRLTGVNSSDKDAVLSDKVDSFEAASGLRIGAEEYAKFAAKIAGDGKLNVEDSAENILKFIDGSELTKLGSLSFKDKNFVLDASAVSKLAALNLPLKVGYGSQISLKETVANLTADNYKLLKNFSALAFKGSSVKKIIDIKGDETLEIDKNLYSSFKFTSDDNIKVTNVSGNVTASDANETFVLQKDAQDSLRLSSFSQNDKLDFSSVAPGVKAIGSLNVASNAQMQLQNGKIYYISDIGTGFASGFAKIFGAGKAFSTKAAGGEKSVILAKTDRGFDIYSVENNGDDEITQDEVKYLGGVNAQSGFHLGDGNLVLA